MAAITTAQADPKAKPWYGILYIQVLIAILIGAVVGWLWPSFATNDWIKALGDGFIKLIKMVIAPIIFCTVVSGIAHIQDAKKVGRIGIKALVYFEIVSTFALLIGLIVGNLVRPGAGFGGAMADATKVADYATKAQAQKSVEFFLHIIPDTVVGAFAAGEILQVLLFSILFGFALMTLGERGHTLRALRQRCRLRCDLVVGRRTRQGQTPCQARSADRSDRHGDCRDHGTNQGPWVSLDPRA